MKELIDMTEKEILNEIDALIDSAPEEYQEKLKQIQWKCDAIRQKHGDNHLAALVEIQQLMWSKTSELTDNVNKFTSIVQNREDK
jgi:hypothetical protein